MKRHIPSTLLLAAVLGGALLFLGCGSQPPSPDTTMTTAELFQHAQDASEKGDYKIAIDYYKIFQQKYPDDVDHNTWASYEIAFIYHKMGDDKKALALFDDLLALYAKADNKLPDGPRILAEKVKAEIEAKLPKPS